MKVRHAGGQGRGDAVAAEHGGTAGSGPRRATVSTKRSRIQSYGEEVANTVSHGLGLLGAIVAAPMLILSAMRNGDRTEVVAASVFAVTMIALYLSSTVYHALPMGRVKRVVRRFDHAAIYLLIAGTYTPLTLGALRGAWGWTLLGMVWGLAIVGLCLENLDRKRARRVSTYLYLVMGWLALIAIYPLWARLPRAGFFLIVAGGVVYTLGVAFYAATNVRYAHLAWHLCVLAGSTCHFVAVIWYS
ncbi:MAG: PAQR family membrane homeostasis protein TrhA [Thermoguttaceae bacterium]